MKVRKKKRETNTEEIKKEIQWQLQQPTQFWFGSPIQVADLLETKRKDRKKTGGVIEFRKQGS
jgi:hypothetical protein